jgi:hypothetical protein
VESSVRRAPIRFGVFEAEGHRIFFKIDYYDRSGQVFKVLTNSGLRRFGKYRRWDVSEMEDLKRKHKTRLEVEDRKIDRGLGDEYFDVRYLERGR